MKNTKWILKSNSGNWNNSTDSIGLNKTTLIDQLIASRGLVSSAEIDKFLDPTVDKIGSPFGLQDMDKGVQIILDAIEKKSSIWIYGDYDVDGITSTSLCYLALSELGANVNYYIPLRDEGYGLNLDAISEIKAAGGEIIISVDCGITSHKEIDFANSLGLRCIITDHHDIIDSVIPKADAVINPKREENSYPFKSLAGVGTAFMLFLGVFDTLNRKDDIYKYLDLVAIGTVADIVTLQDDNRIFVKNGLVQLKNTKLPSLRALLKKIFFEDFETREFTPYDIGFIIAPIFNAAGRLEDAKTSVEFLISKDHTKYIHMIDHLIANNQNRKVVQEEILTKSLESINNKKLYDRNIIIVGGENFHHGVIGIVASKILDKYYKPTIVFEIDRNTGIAKASCRSTENFNMIEALTKHSEFLTKFGGHHGAAGFSMPFDKMEEFYNAMDSYCESVIHEEHQLKPVKIEALVELEDVNYNFFCELKLLEPYGFGNPTPLFAFHNIDYSDLKLIGKEQNHLSLTVKNSLIDIRNCPWFNAGEFYNEISKSKKISVAFKPKLEIYKNRFMYKIFIEDIKLDSQKDFQAISDLKKAKGDSNTNNNNLNKKINFPLKSVFYTEKKITDSKDCKINIVSGKGMVLLNREIIGFLDAPTVAILQKDMKDSNNKYICKITEILETDSNFNVFITIYPDYEFISYSVNQGKLFQDIKNYILGDKSYSEFEKSILGDIFKNNNSPTVNFSTNLDSSSNSNNLTTNNLANSSLITNNIAELENIILTIALFYHATGDKVLIINTLNLSLNDKILYFAQIKTTIEQVQHKYPFYIIIGNSKLDTTFIKDSKFLTITL